MTGTELLQSSLFPIVQEAYNQYFRYKDKLHHINSYRWFFEMGVEQENPQYYVKKLKIQYYTNSTDEHRIALWIFDDATMVSARIDYVVPLSKPNELHKLFVHVYDDNLENPDAVVVQLLDCYSTEEEFFQNSLMMDFGSTTFADLVQSAEMMHEILLDIQKKWEMTFEKHR